jgi:putative tricarboxylic transport membrane protein
MKKNDRSISLILVVFGLYIAFEGYRLKLGTFHEPKPGFLIFWAGIVLTGLSIALFIQTFLSVGKENRTPWKGVQWIKVVKLMAALIAFALVFKWMGFFLSTFLLLLFLLKGLEPQRWRVALAVSIITIVLCYLVFGVFLEFRFPAGIWARIFDQLR